MESNQATLTDRSAIDLETFSNAWFSKKPQAPSESLLEKMRISYEDSAAFSLELFSYYQKRFSSLTKPVEEGFDFYTDMILRHTDLNTTALRLFTDAGELKEYSFTDLDELVEAQYTAWLKKELKPKTRIALVMPFGLEYVVSLLTALKLGLSICYLPAHTPYLSLSQIKEKSKH